MGGTGLRLPAPAHVGQAVAAFSSSRRVFATDLPAVPDL
jgi:hypothetical protein